MYTMVLADDEEIELKALGLLIQKEFRDIDVVAAARNGTELVTQVQRHQPDMAIVDINMPGISGIDAIDLLRSRGVRTRFIINTAYDEFDYVQRALALKIDAYILKPEKRETTVATIQKLCAQIDETRANAQSQRQIRELFTRIQPVMESEIMYSIFIGEPALANFEAYCEMHAAQFTAGAVVALVPVTPSRDGLRGQDKQVLRAALDAAFGGSCTYLATVTETNLCLLLFVPAGQSGGGEAWLNDVVQVALTKLNRSLQLPLRAGVGGVFGQFRQMQESYQQSLLALLQHGQGAVAFYRPPRQAEAGSAEAQLLWCLVQEGNLQQIGAEMARLQPFLQGNRAFAEKLFAQVAAQLAQQKGRADSVHRQLETAAQELARQDAAADFAPVLREKLYQLARLLGEPPQPGAGQYVQQALRYIDEHYASDLSLDMVAEHIGISPFYLSRLFRHQRGENFVEHLTAVRMKAAERLARETALSIKEIAARTGYPNTTYFCRVFKKSNGCTIGELREKHRPAQH